MNTLKRGRMEQIPAKWFPGAGEHRNDVTELCQEIAQRLPLVIIVHTPAAPVPAGEDVAVLKARIAQLEGRLQRRAALDAATMGSAGLPVLEDTEEPGIPMMSATMAGRYGLLKPKRSRLAKFRTALCRWMGGER